MTADEHRAFGADMRVLDAMLDAVVRDSGDTARFEDAHGFARGAVLAVLREGAARRLREGEAHARPGKPITRGLGDMDRRARLATFQRAVRDGVSMDEARLRNARDADAAAQRSLNDAMRMPALIRRPSATPAQSWWQRW